MCGIFGYIGKQKKASSIVYEGLKRLEYRGYDSWGIGIVTAAGLQLTKKVGAIGEASVLTNLPDANIAIGHTRWATHGGVTQINAHPHMASDDSFMVAQNGIVDNFLELKQDLIKAGFKFKSETDTEVIVRLIEKNLKNAKNLEAAVVDAFQTLKGRNTIIVLDNNGQLLAARNGSPLVIGHNSKTDEYFVSSDILSFAPYADNMMMINNGQLVRITSEGFEVKDLKTQKEIPIIFEPVTLTSDKVDKEDFAHFMLKEINETPQALRRLTKQEPELYQGLAVAIKKAKTVYTIGSGTAGIAAAQIAYYLRDIGNVQATSLVGADAKEYLPLITKKDLIIAPSQSGETADVLEILDSLKDKGVPIASFVNMPGSMMTKLSEFPFMAESGPEICVMSTKVFTAQIAWGFLVAKAVQDKLVEGMKTLAKTADAIQSYLDDQASDKALTQVASYLKNRKDIFLLGKSQNFQIMREGMVKLIEGTYKHAHALPAGDLKHYAITLIEKGVPVIVGVADDSVATDVLHAASEVKSRGATVIGISAEQQAVFDYFIQIPKLPETSAIMTVIPLQLLAYRLTVLLGNNVDKPRNIAKSVTVK